MRVDLFDFDLPPDLSMFYTIDDHTDAWTEAETVVFVHGFTECTEAWRSWVPHFSRKYRVVRYDQRGFGQSGAVAIGQFSRRRHFHPAFVCRDFEDTRGDLPKARFRGKIDPGRSYLGVMASLALRRQHRPHAFFEQFGAVLAPQSHSRQQSNSRGAHRYSQIVYAIIRWAVRGSNRS